MEINLTHSDNMATVTVTEASTIAAVIAAMRSVERRIAAKAEDLTTCRNVRKNKMAKWKHNLEVFRAAHRALGDRLVELTEAEVKAEGGKIWVNKWDGDVELREIPIPAEWRNIRGGTSVRCWPCVQAGAIVTHNDRRWKVVVNEIHGGRGGRYVEVFSVYAVVPA